MDSFSLGTVTSNNRHIPIIGGFEPSMIKPANLAEILLHVRKERH